MEETQKVMDIVYGYILKYGLSLVFAIVIFFVGKWLAGVISRWIAKMMEKGKVDAALVGFTKNIVHAAIMVFTILAAIGQLGIQTTSFIAVIGAAGLAIGLSLQGTLSNFAAGVMLILFRPFKVGDFIQAGGEMGSVKEIQIFNTILAHPDNRKIICPNSKISGDTIINFSAIDKRRIDMTFGISYDDDMKVAKKVLTDLVTSDSRILKDPEPTIAVAELGDSSVNLICRPWVNPADYWAVTFDLTEKGKVELEKAGCSIPYPQRDVHLYNEKA